MWYKVQDVRPGYRGVNAGRRRGWLPCHTEVTLVQRNRCRDMSDRTHPMDYFGPRTTQRKKHVYAQATQTCEITECQGDVNTHSVHCMGSPYPTPHAPALGSAGFRRCVRLFCRVCKNGYFCNPAWWDTAVLSRFDVDCHSGERFSLSKSGQNLWRTRGWRQGP